MLTFLDPAGLIAKPVHSCEGRTDATSNDGDAAAAACPAHSLLKAMTSNKNIPIQSDKSGRCFSMHRVCSVMVIFS